MPELPEVETIRRDLDRKIRHKKIKRIEVRKLKIVRGSVADFKCALLGKSFVHVERRAKLLIFKISSGKKFLLIHLKMTGQLIYESGCSTIAGGHGWPPLDRRLPSRYSHVIFTFRDGSRLFFNDLRQFGYLQLVDRATKDKIIAGYGLEPLTREFTLPRFAQVFRGKKTWLKALLLNQGLIAGIGNIYADEICHAAGMRPTRKVSTLKAADIKRLYAASQKILRKAVEKRGTTFSDYVDADGRTGNYLRYLKVYDRAGKKCLSCKKGIIKKIKIGSRGTHYCPVCQK